MVSTAPNDFGMNTIFVFTPERMLLHLDREECYYPDYIFIDEAQIITSDSARSLLYYRIIDRISRLNKPFNIIFSSPNMPNPELFFDLFPKSAIMNLKNKNQYPEHYSAAFSPVSHYYLKADLDNYNLKILNPISREFLLVHKTESSLSLTEFILRVGYNSKNLVYVSSIKNAMIWSKEYAREYPENLISEKNKKILLETSQLIKEKINSSYFLAETIKKGVAYHVRYLPPEIRKNIETLFREGVVHTVFCTSTIIEGVNFPADNLFITSLRDGNSNLNQLEVKNLIGRAGRINFQLFGNVFFVKSNKARSNMADKTIINHCSNSVPKQTLSIQTEEGCEIIKEVTRSLEQNDIELNGEAKDRYKRTLSLMLTTDIVTGKLDSAIVSQAINQTSSDSIYKIKQNFKSFVPDDGYLYSYDQRKNLEHAIRGGLSYPKINEANKHIIDYEKVVDFLSVLSNVFKWDLYEKDTLGNSRRIRWYALLLCWWIEEAPISLIIKKELDRYKKGNDLKVYLNNTCIGTYDKTQLHDNYIINSVLDDIDTILNFKLADYFRLFSKVYEEIFPNSNELFDNNWADFIEYGTYRWKIIELQRVGFSRDSAKIILQNSNYYGLYFDEEGIPHFPSILILNDENELIQREANEIFVNKTYVFVNDF